MSGVAPRLPIGIQTFREIRGKDSRYVDKTAHLRNLIRDGKHFFLSRPRRFGKSLLIDTLKELFECNEPLFRDLAIHGEWDWETPHPVIRIDFAGRSFTEGDALAVYLAAQLDDVERATALESPYATAPERFSYLIKTLAEAAGRRVVVLVDEYDKPILDALTMPELAKANRNALRSFYATIKANEAYIRFTFIAGVSKFSKVSVFSDLNNLTDITLDRPYSSICGYTDADLDRVFAAELEGLDRASVREWYNGYSWRGDERVYNPFDILLLLRSREFRAHWFETGTPRCLIDHLVRERIETPKLDRMVATEQLLSAFDVEHIAAEALLFQTGYLTIVGEENPDGRTRFRLGYPNREVRQGLNDHLLSALLPETRGLLEHGDALRKALSEADFANLELLIRSLFAGIPYNWHVNNPIADYEGYYASVCYSHFLAAGLDARVEDVDSRGRADMALRFAQRIYIFEFKVKEQAGGSALAQLRIRRYADKYRHLGDPIHLVGVEFSAADRNVAVFAAEHA